MPCFWLFALCKALTLLNNTRPWALISSHGHSCMATARHRGEESWPVAHDSCARLHLKRGKCYGLCGQWLSSLPPKALPYDALQSGPEVPTTVERALF